MRCEAGDKAEGFGELDFSKLQARVDRLRNTEVAGDRIAANNWKKGRCKHQTFCYLDEYVRQVQVVGDTVVCGTSSGKVYVLELNGEVRNRLEGLEAEVTSLHYDGTHVAVAGVNGEVWVFSEVTGASPQGVLVHDHGELCVSVQLHGGGAVYSAGVSGGVALSDFHTRLDSSEVLYVQSAIGCMQCTPSYIVLGLGSGQVSVLSVRSSKVILSFTAHESPVTCVQLRRDDELKQEVLVTGAADGSLRSFDFTTGKPLQTFLGHRAAVTCLQFDSAKVVSGSQDGSVRVWDLRSGESLYGLYGYTPFLSSLHFDAHRLLSDGTNNVLGFHDFSAEADVGDADDLDC